MVLCNKGPCGQLAFSSSHRVLSCHSHLVLLDVVSALIIVLCNVMQGPYLPGYVPTPDAPKICYGIRRLDHAVGNVPNLIEAVKYIMGFTGTWQCAAVAGCWVTCWLRRCCIACQTCHMRNLATPPFTGAIDFTYFSVLSGAQSLLVLATLASACKIPLTLGSMWPP